MFSINCLEIKEEVVEGKRNLYRNLNKGYYLFNDFYRLGKAGDGSEVLIRNNPSDRALPKDFFGQNINIQAIVGTNGSGKSSILNLIYMAINNYSYMFDRDNKRPLTEKTHYIPNLHIALYFSIDDVEYKLVCSDKEVNLSKNGEDPFVEFELKLNECSEGDKYKGRQGTDLRKLLQCSFYTIVSNYSMQSFLPSGNSIEGLYEHVDGLDRVIGEKCCWIDGIFHKNDGYVKSIVLNPFRDYGKIDGEKEIELSKDRLCSLMIFDEQNSRSIFGEYSFNNLEMTLNSNVLKDKLLNLLKLYSIHITDEHMDTDVCSIVDDVLSNSICDVFLIDKVEQPVFDTAMAYLQIKIATLIKKYEKYAEFDGVVAYNASSKKLCADTARIKSLLEFIYDDESHLAKKIWRTVNFLRAYSYSDTLPCSFTWNDYVSKLKEYYANKYLDLQARETAEIRDRANPFGAMLYSIASKNTFIAPESIDKCLPPPFFEKKLLLNKKEKGVTSTVYYNNLSSGELQLLQTLSIHLYHIENVLSIREFNRYLKKQKSNLNLIPEYHCVNLVFDEIEICFHPEYQRCFIQRFISMLNMMRINNELKEGGVYLNIILVTHSPFVLSDIPSSNILYLPKDADSDKKRKNAFAGNIAEMFYESFFLEHTIGAFAYNKVKDLIKSCQDGDRDDVSKKNNELVKKCIGDTVIRSLIEKMN